ncbi:hypothetical protein [Embleya sp. AB8]|uniref:hypothetical protein n=1 Tax=Embleya sp. AB8 TaxID=3156304 RepID=UPI003C732EEB
MTWWRNPRQRLGVIGAVVAVVVILALVHRDRGDEATADTSGITAASAASAASGVSGDSAASGSGPAGSGVPGAAPAASPTVRLPKSVLPDVVGVDLQEAWDGARRAGYRFVTSHDASGRGRRQFIYSNWKVCDQKPGAGPLAKELPVELGVVRNDEKCPAGTVATTGPEVVDGRMPNLIGRSVNVVRRGLRGDAHVKVEDLRGDRPVLIETHWVVCTQRPAEGQPVPDTVGVGVVKYGEHCPR